MSKKQKPAKPSELPVPGPEPGVKPDSPVEPLFPEREPEIAPSVEPEEPRPGPSEIPVPEKET